MGVAFRPRWLLHAPSPLFSSIAGNNMQFTLLLTLLASTNAFTNPTPRACSALPDTGMCKGKFESFYYNATMDFCDCYVYGGCGNPSNHFKTLEDCTRTCKPLHPAPRSFRENCVAKDPLEFQNQPASHQTSFAGSSNVQAISGAGLSFPSLQDRIKSLKLKQEEEAKRQTASAGQIDFGTTRQKLENFEKRKTAKIQTSSVGQMNFGTTQQKIENYKKRETDRLIQESLQQ